MGFAVRENRLGKFMAYDPWLNTASVEGMKRADKKYWLAVNHEAILKGFRAKISQFGLKIRSNLFRSTSENAPTYLSDRHSAYRWRGFHSEATSYLDVTKWVRLSERRSSFCDDITWGTTGKLVLWVDEHCIKWRQFEDDAAWGIWVKN